MNLRRLAGRLLSAMALVVCVPAWSLDPPHDASTGIECLTCHMAHNSPGGALNTVAGNANLCMTCHNPAGNAAPRPFADQDQALPGVRGSSHRWDSGPAGHVQPALTNTSTGIVRSGGLFTGRIEKSYTITIVSTGAVGAASFSWSDGQGNGGVLVTGLDVPLADGLVLDFIDGAGGTSFVTGNTWTLRVRTDIVFPNLADAFERPLAQRMPNEKVVCSTCHDQHSQSKEPFDPNAPPFGGPGTGWISTGVGRHFQRQTNDSNQMCKICHRPRDVQTAAQGSHPVSVPIPPPQNGFQTPAALPLDPQGRVQCMSCHRPHYTTSGNANGGAGDGYILREAIGELCYQCHTLADRAGGSHFNTTSGVLWPGGQYGSSFPAHTAEKRGFCINCHWPHGWPDNDNPAQDFGRLWVERYDLDRTGRTDPDDAEDLCFTCHDGAPAQTNIKADIEKGTNGAEIFHHPVKDSQQSAGRTVECVECHNPHRATPADRLAGVSGVDLAGNPIAAGSRPIQQQELCFKCHGDSFNSGRNRTSNKRLDFNTTTANSGYHPVSQPGRGQSANLAAQLLGGLNTASTIRCTDCHNSDAFSGTVGPVTDSPANTFGPHGSTFAPILRANFNLTFTGTGWNNNNANLCFSCHDQTRLLSRDFGSGARTNFDDEANPAGSRGKRNLHWYHLVDRGVTGSCLSCHYDIHSNRSAGNTEYCVGTSINACTVTTSPPANVKSHLVNFAPDVQPLNFPRPRWHINTTTGVRTCDVTCHGSGNKMDRVTYRPPSGDETSYTY